MPSFYLIFVLIKYLSVCCKVVICIQNELYLCCFTHKTFKHLLIWLSSAVKKSMVVQQGCCSRVRGGGITVIASNHKAFEVISQWENHLEFVMLNILWNGNKTSSGSLIVLFQISYFSIFQSLFLYRLWARLAFRFLKLFEDFFFLLWHWLNSFF